MSKTKTFFRKGLVYALVCAIAIVGLIMILPENSLKMKADAIELTSWPTSFTAGNTYNINLGADLTFSDISTYPTAKGCLAEIPANTVVNLNLQGHTISYEYKKEDSAAGFCQNYSDSVDTGSRSYFWGLIRNNGTLTITNSGSAGSIEIRVADLNHNMSSAHDDLIQRCTAIVNKGTLNLSKNVNIEAYTVFDTNSVPKYTSSGKYADLFCYSIGIYNEGVINSTGANIEADAYASSSSVASKNSYHYAVAHGVFGGTVNVNGGKITANAYSGAGPTTSTCEEKNQIFEMATSISAVNTTVMGSAVIKAFCGQWQGYADDDDDCYGNWNLANSYSVGIMYTGTNYPTIGAGVSMTATTQALKGTYAIPGYSTETRNLWTENDIGDCVRKSYLVAGFTSFKTPLYGAQTEETTFDGSAWLGESDSSFNAQSCVYKSELAYRTGSSTLCNLKTACTDSTLYTKTHTSFSDTSANSVVMSSGAPGTSNSQYMVIYRFYNASGSLLQASYKPVYDGVTVSNEGVIGTKDGNSIASLGVDCTGASLSYLSGGESLKPNYYEFSSVKGELLAGATYVSRNITDNTAWASSGSSIATVNDNTASMAGNLSPASGKVMVFYYNYTLRNPSSIRVAVEDKGNKVSLSSGTSVEVNYTGKTIVPGTDFNIGIISMGMDTSIAINSPDDDYLITEPSSSTDYDLAGYVKCSPGYKIKGTETDRAIAVTYSYSKDGSVYTSGLPKEAGSYTIKVVVASDTNMNIVNSGNRNGGEFYIDLTIKAANVTIGGADAAYNETYGSKYNAIIKGSDFTVTGVNGETPTGTITFASVNEDDTPAVVTNATIKMVWTPDEKWANCYNETEFNVYLTITKKNITVKPGSASVTYGDIDVTYTTDAVVLDGIPEVDQAKIAGWIKNTTFVYRETDSSSWLDYTSKATTGNYPEAKTYQLGIASFGGADNTNYNFVIDNDTEPGTFTVNKKDISFSMSAVSREYNATEYIDVKFTYESGLVSGTTDTFNITYNKKANSSDETKTLLAGVAVVDSADVGNNKTVKITDTSVIDYKGNNAGCYNLVISNNSQVKVNITKASVVVSDMDSFDIKYDSAKSLEEAVDESTISATQKASYDGTTDVAGVWTWKNGSVIPTVGASEYEAVFTPNDSTNFSSVTEKVTVNVSKAVITISVPEQKVTYGDAVPAIGNKLVYTGWTGGDKLSDITTTGIVEVKTDYKPGMGVGSYPITISSTLASQNYEFVVSSTVTNIVVGKKAITVTPDNNEIVYGSEKPEYSDSDVTVSGLYGSDTVADFGGTLSVTTTYVKNCSVGEYDIVCSGWTSDNYSITFNKGVLTVTKAVLKVTPVEVNISYGEDVPSFECTYSGFVGADTSIDSVTGFTGKVSYDTTYSKGANAGITYSVTSDVSNLSSKNYSFVSDSNKVNVSKAHIAVATMPTATITFTQSLGEAVFTGAVVVNSKDSSMKVDGKFAFNKKDEVPIYDNNGATYVCTFTPTDLVNYYIATIQNVPITINKKQISGVPVINGSTMVGQTLTVNVNSVNPADIAMFDIQWIKDDADISGQTAENYQIPDSDKGHVLKVRITAKDGTGYTDSAESVATAAIFQYLTPVSTDILDISVPSDLTFDGEEHYAEVSVKSTYAGYVGAVTVLYNGSTVVPKDAGTYYVTCNVAEPKLKSGDLEFDENYYGPTSGISVGTFKINPKDYSVSFTPDNKTYDGTNTATVSSITKTGAIDGTDVILKQGSYVFDSVDVGNNIIVSAVDMELTGTDKDNYNLIVSQSVANITKATINAKAVAVSRAYDPDSDVVDITFNVTDGYVNGETKESVYFTNGKGVVADKNVGTNSVSNITYTMNGDKKDNYQLVITNEASVTCIITKATPKFTSPVISGLTYDKTRKVSAISLADYNTSIGKFEFVNKDEIPTCDKQEYKGKFVATNSNYNSVDCVITVKLNKKNVTLIADDKEGTYGQEAPTLTVTAVGFCSGDSLTSEDASVINGYYSTSTTYSIGNGIGEYTISIDAGNLSSPNYTFSTTDGVLTIKKAVVNVIATAENKVYDKSKNVNVSFSIKDGIYSGDDGKISLSFTSTTGYAKSSQTGTWAVNYAAVPELKSADNTHKNYEINVTPVSGALIVTITQADPTGVVFPVGADMVFGNTVSTAVFITEGEGTGSFEFAEPNKKPTIVGTEYFTVKFVPSDSNYKTITSEIPVNISTAEVEFVLGIAGSNYAGSVLTPVFTGCPKDAENYMSFVWYREQNGKKYAVGTERTYTTTEDDQDCYIYLLVSFPENSPYQLSASMTTETLASDGNEGVVSATTQTIQEKFKTFWERLIEWWRALIEAITSISFGL